LILNKHESYDPAELRRIISDDGVFLTQQVGGLNDRQVNEHFDVPINDEFKNWNLSTALEEIEQAGFKVEYCKEEFPVQRFYDVGALVYYLKAIPWQIPNFSIEEYMDDLYKIHRIIQNAGYFEVNQHRFIIKARVA